MRFRANFFLVGSIILGGVYASYPQTPTPVPSPVSGPTSVFTVTDTGILRKGEFTFSGAHQRPQVRTERLKSTLMAREMPYRVALPAGYSDPSNANKRYPVVYLLHGLTGHYDNWIDKTDAEDLAAGHAFILVTPEGENGWYTDSAAKPNDKYESYVVKELIPEIDKSFRTVADREHRAIAGLSMGGFGAVKFGLKYPELFSLAGSFSGALGAATITEKQFPGAIGKTITEIFGPEGSEVRRSNDPFEIVRHASPDKIKRFPFLYIDCGTEDFLFQNNREFVGLLLERKVPHEFRQLPGGHNWTYWQAQAEEFLELAAKRFSGGPGAAR